MILFIKKTILRHVLVILAMSNGIQKNCFADFHSGSFGINAGATDIYQVTCSLDTALSSLPSSNIVVSIGDGTVGVGKISVQVTNGVGATNVTDSIGGDGRYSEIRGLAINPPAYDAIFTVLVDHTVAGVEVYGLNYHCQDAQGNHAGTSIVQIQDQ